MGTDKPRGRQGQGRRRPARPASERPSRENRRRGTPREPARRTDRPRPESRGARGAPIGDVFVTARGDGLLLREDGEAEASIPGALLGGAIHRDRVRVEIVRDAPAWARRIPGRVSRPTVRVVEVLSHGLRRFTGRLAGTPVSAVEPDDPKLPHVFPLAEADPARREGDPVVAEILPVDASHPGRLAARVVAAFAGRDDVGMEIERILIREGLDEGFPEAALEQARRTTPGSLLSGDPRDLTGLPFVTIDPEDARDHDDAVAVVPAAGGSGRSGEVDVWVAIADVSSAVPSGSPLDVEARRRGLSVYLPDRVVPMLPEPISADACSLREGEDRAALAVRVRLGRDGRQIGSTEVVRAVIRSRAYLTYGEVAELLDGSGGRPARGPGAALLPALELADGVARTLRAARLAAGSLDLDLPEAHVVLDDRGGVASIRPRATTAGERDAYRLIEEMMLLANRGIARLLIGMGAPGVFRVHEPPDEAAARKFAGIARHYGIPIRPDRATEHETLAKALAAMRGRPFAEPLASLLLRTMKQARYAPVNLGHFGLAFREYLHFTSPIRRYPDLVVHRIVRAVIDGAGPADLAAMARSEAIDEAAAVTSVRERRGMLVEREVDDLYAAWLMTGFVGAVLEGSVVGLGPMGLFVRLPEPFVEGLVAIEDLPPDDWRFVADEHRLAGRGGGRSFKLGAPVRIEVVDSSVARRRIHFRLADAEASRPRPRGRQPRPRRVR